MPRCYNGAKRGRPRHPTMPLLVQNDIVRVELVKKTDP